MLMCYHPFHRWNYDFICVELFVTLPHSYIPAKCPGGLWNFHRGMNLNIHWGTIERLWYNEIWQWPGILNLWPGIPAGVIFYRGHPRWVNFTPGWKPAGHLAGMYLLMKNFERSQRFSDTFMNASGELRKTTFLSHCQLNRSTYSEYS